MHDELKWILDQRLLRSAFQPINNLSDGSIFALEALIRGPAGSRLAQPDALFLAAEEAGKSVEVEYACRREHIKSFSTINYPYRLFLNVNPLVLLRQDFTPGFTKRYLAKHGITPNQVVIEVTEHSPIEDYSLIRRALDHYKSMGFRVAVDDLGAGYSSLRHWLELRPEFIKIDRSFISGIDQDSYLTDMVGTLATVARRLGCTMIAEGIETEGELDTVKRLGIPMGQGYYLGPPKPAATFAGRRTGGMPLVLTSNDAETLQAFA